MTQMTVEKLFNELKELVDNGQGSKKVVVADDNEGNGFHGCFFSIVSNPTDVENIIDGSNGLYDSQATDYKDIVIIG